MKFVKGRQNSGYDKMKIIISSYFMFDVYILRFNEGSYIDTHVDKAKDGYEHHRINIILKSAREGGEFVCENTIFRNSFINYFRPDIEEHAVTRIDEGTRYVLSIGWLRKKRV